MSVSKTKIICNFSRNKFLLFPESPMGTERCLEVQWQPNLYGQYSSVLICHTKVYTVSQWDQFASQFELVAKRIFGRSSEEGNLKSFCSCIMTMCITMKGHPIASNKQ